MSEDDGDSNYTSSSSGQFIRFRFRLQRLKFGPKRRYYSKICKFFKIMISNR